MSTAPTPLLSLSPHEPGGDTPMLSEEELDTLRKRMAALDKLLHDEGKAKWKIEIGFFHKRSLSKTSVGAISIWESGRKAHGGGDTKAYFCPAKELKRGSCEGVIPDSSNGFGHLVCPRCQHLWTADQVYGEILGRWTTRTWADKILEMFRRVDHNADIYLKYPLGDIREAARVEQERQWHGEKLEKVRGDRLRYIYPLKNIIKDTASGADLLGRFYAFLTA